MKNYKIAVAGTGYVGLSLSVLLAQHNQVMAVDIVQAKVDMIVGEKGEAAFLMVLAIVLLLSRCQSDGFRKFSEMKRIRERVYVVDIICHGSPSPKLWREYAESIQKSAGKITYLTFKDKRKGWKSPTAYVKINGGEKSIKDYVKVFYNRCALRPSCYECLYATTERKTDLTIGDFWHIEETIPDFYDPNGNSLFLIHTNRGEELFEKIRSDLDYRLSNTTQCWQANLEAPTQKSEQREEFWSDYKKKGIDFVMKKYGTVPVQTKIKNKILKIFKGGGYTESSTCYADCSERRAA